MKVRVREKGAWGGSSTVTPRLLEDMAGPGWREWREGSEASTNEGLCVTQGPRRGAFLPALASALPFREAILRSEMLSESGWFLRPEQGGGFLCSRSPLAL